ncbi:MAG: hypothetical protein KDK35_04895 [Leptospiraceae bacterium]|nr:hypothetical protein [Leptospiraceae bacterium]MCP5485933.1 hypothetical protein [Spirochaetales bacterium]
MPAYYLNRGGFSRSRYRVLTLLVLFFWGCYSFPARVRPAQAVFVNDSVTGQPLGGATVVVRSYRGNCMALSHIGPEAGTLLEQSVFQTDARGRSMIEAQSFTWLEANCLRTDSFECMRQCHRISHPGYEPLDDCAPDFDSTALESTTDDDGRLLFRYRLVRSSVP